jgi:NADH-quinone oxidoreductase subunit L
VSALIHAATMVTAGVYLVARAHPFFEASGDAMTVVAWVGGLTALLAGGAALLQPDLKRVLAYSTISQLGYMFLALGVGAYTAAVFMVLTHAFFKGCLFLGAGSVIHGNDENQDMRIMGRFRRFLPFTAIAMAFAWLSISGIPPFAGFWSKDSILESAYLNGDYGVWIVGLLAAIFTAMYMTRLIQLTFYGNERFRPGEAENPVPAVSGGSDDDVPEASGGTTTATLEAPEIDPLDTEEALGYDPAFDPTVDFVEPPRATRLGDHDPDESPVIMLIPILTLAFLAIVGGLMNLPIEGLEFLDEWLAPVFAGVQQPHPESFVQGLVLEGISVVFAVVGITAALLLYRRGLRNASADPIAERTGKIGEMLGHAYYYDEGLAAFTDGPGMKTARFLDETVDQKIIDGSVNGVAKLVRQGGLGLRKLQDGYVRRYAIGILLGAVAILLFLVAYVAR